MTPTYIPNFEVHCEACGTSPCVIVQVVVEGDTVLGETEQCGPCYFADRQMLDYWLWNDEDTAFLITVPFFPSQDEE